MDTSHALRAPLGGWTQLILALLLLFIVFRVLVLARRRQRRERRRTAGQELAGMLGWEHRLGDAGRVELDEWRGTLHGVAWVMEVRAPAPHASGRGQRRYTRWHTPDLRLPDGFVAVMAIPADQQAKAGATFQLGQQASGLAGVLAQRATELFLRTYFQATFGVEGRDVFGGELTSLSKWTPDELAATHTIISSDEQLARDFMTSQVAGLFLKWREHAAGALPGHAGTPAALLWREGLALCFPAGVQGGDELQRAATFGAALATLASERPPAAPGPVQPG